MFIFFTLSAVDLPKVYFTKDISSESIIKLYHLLGRPIPEGAKVAVKVSTGEPGGHNFLDPYLVKPFVDLVNGTIVENNVAYASLRHETETHREVVKAHHWDIMNNGYDILDAEGDEQIPIPKSQHLSYNIVGSHMKKYNFLVVLTHFKGHAMGGFGGAFKNMAIGLGSARGKCNIHSGGVEQNPLLGVLAPQDVFLESMTEAVSGILNFYKKETVGDQAIFINIMSRMSIDCDCDSNPADPRLADIGILASLDPVAIDKACVDKVRNSEDPGKGDLVKRMEQKHGTRTIEYAAELGLGSLEYELIDIDDELTEL
jgi:hypothetical protein